MPTTTATITLSSPDIDAFPLDVTSTTTLYNAGLDTGVEHTTGMNRKIIKADDTGPVQLISTIIGGVFMVKGASFSSGNAVVTQSADTTVTRKVGQAIIGTNIADSTTILSVDSSTQFTMDKNSTGAVSSGEGSVAIAYNKYTANKANKIYICNSSTDDSDYVVVTISTEEIGRLYAGDWMLMPWSAATSLSNIFITAATQTSTAIVDYMVIGEGDS